MAFVFKISKPGVDVKKATNPQLRVNSENTMYKIYASGSFSFDVTDTAIDTFITHTLGYKPASLILLQYNQGGAYRRATGFGITGDEIATNILTDNEKITVQAFSDSPGNKHYNGYYYIFYDPVDE